jgi:hypothetical protein
MSIAVMAKSPTMLKDAEHVAIMVAEPVAMPIVIFESHTRIEAGMASKMNQHS